MEYLLGSSDTLPVGRYVLAVRDKETGGAGYGRFLVNDSKCSIDWGAFLRQ